MMHGFPAGRGRGSTGVSVGRGQMGRGGQQHDQRSGNYQGGGENFMPGSGRGRGGPPQNAHVYDGTARGDPPMGGRGRGNQLRDNSYTRRGKGSGPGQDHFMANRSKAGTGLTYESTGNSYGRGRGGQQHSNYREPTQSFSRGRGWRDTTHGMEDFDRNTPAYSHAYSSVQDQGMSAYNTRFSGNPPTAAGRENPGERGNFSNPRNYARQDRGASAGRGSYSHGQGYVQDGETGAGRGSYADGPGQFQDNGNGTGRGSYRNGRGQFQDSTAGGGRGYSDGRGRFQDHGTGTGRDSYGHGRGQFQDNGAGVGRGSHGEVRFQDSRTRFGRGRFNDDRGQFQHNTVAVNAGRDFGGQFPHNGTGAGRGSYGNNTGQFQDFRAGAWNSGGIGDQHADRGAGTTTYGNGRGQLQAQGGSLGRDVAMNNSAAFPGQQKKGFEGVSSIQSSPQHTNDREGLQNGSSNVSQVASAPKIKFTDHDRFPADQDAQVVDSSMPGIDWATPGVDWSAMDSLGLTEALPRAWSP